MRTTRLLLVLLLGGLPMRLQAEVVLVVAQENPVQSLTTEQVARIFLRKKANLPDGIVLEPVDQPKGALRDQFYTDFIGMTRARVNAYWAQRMFTGAAQPPLQTTPDQNALAVVAVSKYRIGYADAAALTSDVRVIKVMP